MEARTRPATSSATCPLCGGSNDCALARRRAEGTSEAGAEGAAGAEDSPCWCVGQSFPAPLRARARAIDGGAACVCRRCLEAESAAGR